MPAFPFRLAAALALVLAVSPASAEDPPFSDLAGREPIVRDLAPRPAFADFDGDGADLTVVFSTRQSETRSDYGGSLVLTLPTERWLAPPSPKAKRAPESDGDAPPASPGEPRVVPRAVAAFPLPLLRPRDARAAISAALDTAGLSHARQRLDDLDARARWSGLMPQLRLRATRLVDESQSFSPTSYDAERTTSSGGASLWLEARATFRLDRLVFAGEELRVERMRRDVSADGEKLAARVLETLFAWQRSAHALYDPWLTPEACMKEALSIEELTVRLDWITDGWFSRWQVHHPLPEGSCLDSPAALGDHPIAE